MTVTVGQVRLVTSERRAVLGTWLRITSYREVIDHIIEWSTQRDSRYLCFAPVHLVMEAYANPAYAAAVNGADLTVPDGVPLVWALRALGSDEANRVYGPDTTEHTLAAAERHGIEVGFYGSTPTTLERLVERVRRQFPALVIAFAYSPPFRALTNDEDLAITNAINDSGARILFVGLGCPKQEQWMADHRDRVMSVMMGVGAAFDFLAGTKPQAPRWMMRSGTEWVFRLLTEPRRLWIRYLSNNPRFVCLFLKQLLREMFAN